VRRAANWYFGGAKERVGAVQNLTPIFSSIGNQDSFPATVGVRILRIFSKFLISINSRGVSFPYLDRKSVCNFDNKQTTETQNGTSLPPLPVTVCGV
jgi:hypothetical protein